MSDKNVFLKERRIRKVWLFLALTRWVGFPILFLVGQTAAIVAAGGTWLEILPMATVMVLFISPVLWIYLHCTYKKRGTGWLTFWLVAESISILLALISIPRWIHEVELESSQIVGMSVGIVLFAGWYCVSWKLRKANRNYQIRSFLSSGAYAYSVDKIRSATDLNDLEFKFHDVLRGRPDYLLEVFQPYFEEKRASLAQ